MDHYEAVPYQSIPFPDSHPGHLAAVGRLFGLTPADPARARVLELACASGGNLIPLAWYHPQGRFVGIDLAPNQVADGQALIQRLGLTNCELRAGDILDLDPGLGEFDYIVAHGVYSWVPGTCASTCCACAATCSPPRGSPTSATTPCPAGACAACCATCSSYAARGAETAQAKLGGRPGRHGPYGAAAVDRLDALSARYLKSELDSLQGRPTPSYLLHEYLATENQAFLLRDFIADAADQGLTLHRRHRAPAPSSRRSSGTGVERALARYRGPGIETRAVARLRRQPQLPPQPAVPRRRVPMVEPASTSPAFEAMAFSADLTPPNKLDLRRPKPAPFRQTSWGHAPTSPTP